MAEEMILFSRTYDLLDWLLPKTRHFPRIYRHTVSRRLCDAALDFQEHLLDAQTRRGRQRLAALQNADSALNRVRLYLRLAHHWHWLNDGQYQHVSRMVMELGRLLGGWLRQAGSTKR
jgi:hypothetical protein